MTVAMRAPRRVRALRAVLPVLLLTGVLAAAPGASYAQAAAPAPRLVVTGAAAVPGSIVVVKGTGFPRRLTGHLTVAQRPVARYRTSQRGTFTARFSMPDSSGGALQLVAARPSGRVLVTVPLAAARSSASPPAGGFLPLVPAGSWRALPGDAEAAAMVRRSTWEPRPQNATANRTMPTGLSLTPHGGVEPIWNSWLLPRVTGRFTGTTDEIVQWAAAKWGFPDDLLRAQMVAESTWYQGLLDPDGQPVPQRGFGDYTADQGACAHGYTAPCPLSFGVLQIKHAAFHGGTFPHSRDSTAFTVDYLGAVLRGCYEGWESWLAGSSSASPRYAAGDLTGCLGRWYAGAWRTAEALDYAQSVEQHRVDRPWLTPGF